MAMPSRSDASARHCLIRHGHRQPLGKQIIHPLWRGTVMRHIIFARPVTTRPHRMIEAAAAARLVTPPGLALRQQSRFLSTALATVHVAVIAMAADEHLGAAAQAPKEPGGRCVSVTGASTAGIRGGQLLSWTH